MRIKRWGCTLEENEGRVGKGEKHNYEGEGEGRSWRGKRGRRRRGGSGSSWWKRAGGEEEEGWAREARG